MNRSKLNPKKKAMIAALEKSLGVVTTAAKNSGVARQLHYDWIKQDENYRQAVEAIGDIALDFAESQLHKQIQEGNTTATIFFLKTKGKGRGYIERNEIAGVENEPLTVRVLFEDYGSNNDTAT